MWGGWSGFVHEETQFGFPLDGRIDSGDSNAVGAADHPVSFLFPLGRFTSPELFPELGKGLGGSPLGVAVLGVVRHCLLPGSESLVSGLDLRRLSP